MKRSEMVINIINEICNHEPISRKKKNIEIAADWILKIIERSGMQPPSYLITIEDPFGLPYKKYEYGWEPEDETE